MITVYTLPNCVQCSATVRHLNRLGLEYFLEDAQEALTVLREAGHTIGSRRLSGGSQRAVLGRIQPG